MRLALVIAPSDTRSGDAGLRREALAWLRGRLARFGFHVVIVGGVQDPQADIDRAISRVSEGDTVLVHASGRLAGRDAIAFGDTGLIALASLTEALAERSPAHVSFVLELTHEEEENDALLAAEILEATMHALRAKPRGYPVLAAVRPLSMAVDRVAFTRLALPAVSEHSGPPPTEALVASMYDAASATDESHAVAQSFTFARGGASIPPPARQPMASAIRAHAQRSPESAGAHAEVAEVAEPIGEGAIEAAESVSASPPMSAPPSASWPPSMSAPPSASSPDLSIHSMIAEATEQGDWARALELRRHRLHILASPSQKARELVAIARILQAEFGDAEGAIDALEMARAMDQKRTTVLQALRRGYEKLGRWANALEVTAAHAALTESPVDRANLNVACALIALQRMGDVDRAVAWFDAALTADPTNGDALAALNEYRGPPAPDLPPAMPVAPVIEAPPRSELPPRVGLPPPMGRPPRTEPLPRTAPQTSDSLHPSQRVEAPPADAASREHLADRLFAEGDEDGAFAELEAVAAWEPTRVSVYEKTFSAHRRAGRTDSALLAAFVLEDLGAADVDQQVLIDQFRSVQPIRARSPIDDGAWTELLAPGSDAVLTALFAAVENAAMAARTDELREQRKLIVLDPEARLSATSTASIVRSFQWAARVLTVRCPHLYVRDDVPGGIATISAREPSTGLGPSVVSGRSAKDLAFLAGQHLTYHRPGFQVLLHYADRDELTTLLLAAAQVSMPAASAQSTDPAVRALRARLARHLEADERTALDLAVRALDARGGQAALGAWMCSVELTANRVGLLLAGDLATAMVQIRAEANQFNVPMEIRRGDLLAFCASREHAAMRSRFATTAPESLFPSSPPPPPPPSSSSLQIGP